MTNSSPRKVGAVPDFMFKDGAEGHQALSTENIIVKQAIAAMNPNTPAADPELQRKMAVVLRHLHAAVDELDLKEHELLATFDFIARVAKNNDTMMLGDMLGISMRVNDLTYRTPKGTAPNVIGPLYRDDAPFMSNPGSMIEDSEPGEHVWMQGTVSCAETGKPLEGAVLDFWQTNMTGTYENEDPNMPDYHFRRRIKTNGDGTYRFKTVVPGAYSIATRDTPVYDFMQKLGRGVRRASHLHVVIMNEGYKPLTTMTYFEGAEGNDADCIFSCRPENMAKIQAAATEGELKQCRFDIVLTRET